MTKQRALDIGVDLAAIERATLTGQLEERFIALGGFAPSDPDLIDVRERLALTSIEVLREAIATDAPARAIERFKARMRAEGWREI